MQEQDREKFGSALITSFAVYNQSLLPKALPVWWAVLETFDIKTVLGALLIWNTTKDRAPAPNQIRELCLTGLDGQGWPDAALAWAGIPFSEYESAVWTDEAAEAWGQSMHLYNPRNDFACRAAFESAYASEVTKAKSQGKAIRWTISRGRDRTRWPRAFAEAVKKKAASLDWCLRELHEPESAQEFLKLVGITDHPLLNSPPPNLNAIRMIKDQIKGIGRSLPPSQDLPFAEKPANPPEDDEDQDNDDAQPA